MAKPPTDHNCGNCANYIDGACHFNPPQTAQTGTIGHITVGYFWPRTQPTDWCAQWTQAK